MASGSWKRRIIKMVKIKVENESSQERFRRIASNRTNRLLDNLRLLGNCANRNVYSYDEKQIASIFNAIERELKSVKTLFNNHKNIRKVTL